jgi:hypothetical protein
MIQKNRRTRVGITSESANFKGYGVVILLGAIGGVALYHLYGKAIDSVYNKIPYLNKLPSFYTQDSEYY